MEVIGIEGDLFDCLRDLYREFKVQVKVGNYKGGELRLDTEVRQGCPANPTLFDICFSDLKEEMTKAQEAGLVVGNRKIFSIFYADDIDPLATSIEGLKKMMTRL